MECIFCRIVAKEIPSFVVYEDKCALAFLDVNPISRGHTLIMPRAHVERISELSERDLSGLSQALQKVVRGIEGSLKPEGLNFLVNQGEVAGQVIPHLHIHVTPRKMGDGIVFVTPKFKMTNEELKVTSEEIKKAIKV